MIPANNTTMEHELPAWLPAGSTCRTLRIPRGKGMLTQADLPGYIAQATTMAKSFADDGIDAVVYGCTAAGFLAGPDLDAQVAVDLRAVTGKPTVTTASAMAAALKDIGARNIALVTPYLDAVNERLKAFLTDSGIAVQVLSTAK
jgi:maleate cis-trans isomerase